MALDSRPDGNLLYVRLRDGEVAETVAARGDVDIDRADQRRPSRGGVRER